MDDRTQQTDRPGRKILTGIAIAACGGVIALLLEYFVFQDWFTPDTHPWNSNGSPRAIGGVSADGTVEAKKGSLIVNGTLWDKVDDDKTPLLILLVDDGTGVAEHHLFNADGPRQPKSIHHVVPDEVESIKVRECLIESEKAGSRDHCSGQLQIWP